MQRRRFIHATALGTAGILLPGYTEASQPVSFTTNRPPENLRTFRSKAVDQEISQVIRKIKDPEIAWMFENCYPNTLDTTVKFQYKEGRPDTFIITGDINAMWLRDSTAQVWPYLHLVKQDADLQNLFKGLIARQTGCIRFDPYANAFNDGPTGSYWESDLTDMKPELHERKWEIDSLCYPVRLAYHYWAETGDTSPFDLAWKQAAQSILKTFKEQQRREGKGPYRFMRITEKPTDTMPGNGYGNPVMPNGLICSAFRPSDDATTFLFLIPSNYFAVVSLKQMAEIAEKVYLDTQFSASCNELAGEVEDALNKFAVADHPYMGKVIPYEADGFGNFLFMDDANIPSLLSLPYLGAIDPEHPLYRNTRRLILSRYNPWYFEGEAASGIGGPHVGEDMFWPMALIMQALTSDSDEEIVRCLKWLKNSHAGTGFMHETFHKDDPAKYTRSWFAWANTLFGELILTIATARPHLLNQIF